MLIARDNFASLNALIQSVPIAAALLDTQFTYLTSNPAWDSLYSKEALPDEWHAICQQALQGETQRQDIGVFPALENGSRAVKWEVQPWYTDAQQVGGVIIYLQDISDSFYRTTLQKAPVYVAVYDTEYRFQFVNTMGGAASPIIGQSILNFTEPDYHAVTRAAFEQVRDGAPAAIYEAASRQPDGLHWFRTTVVPLKRDDQITGYVASSFDITERKRIEDTLRQSEYQYRQILDAIGDMVLVKGEKSRIIWANKGFRDYYGMSNEDLQGMIDAPFNEPDYTQQYILDDAQVFNSGQPLNIEEPVTRHDGLVRQFNTLKTPIFDENGKVVMTVGVSRDMTDRIEQAKALQRSEGRYRALVETSPDFIVLMDRDYKMRFTNVLAEGLTLENVMGVNVLNFMPLEYHTQAKAAFDAVFSGNSVMAAYESPGLRRNGTMGWTAVRVTPIIEGDHVHEAMLIVTDVTERRHAELERERLIKELKIANRIAQENSRLKSEFLATMSHELRTPLNAIEGFTSIILSKMGGAQYNDKTERYVQRIHVNSKRLLDLINDFLDLSRIESGRLELAHMPFSPAALGEKWQAEIGILADKKQLKFDLKVDPALPETLYGDEEAISKVAINLMGNAIKFTEKGSIEVSLSRQENDWTIEVTDTGIGIPPHAREYIFDEFRQVDQTSRRKFGGTGLGLAIVQKMVRLMDGTVTVKSEFGKGSTFSITLPMQLEPVITGGVAS